MEFFTREICVCAHLTQTRDALEKCAGMEISVKNMPDSIFFASHIYMTLAILCRRRHKVVFKYLRQRDACGMEISVKNGIFHTRDLCLRALDTNSRCAKSVRRNGD